MRYQDKYPPWTAADIALLKEMFAQKKERWEMCSVLSRGRKQVADKLRRLGFAEKKERLEDPWTDAEVATLRKLCAQGLSNPIIGERIGRTDDAVVGKIHRLGIVKAKPVKPPPVVKPKPLPPVIVKARVEVQLRDIIPFTRVKPLPPIRHEKLTPDLFPTDEQIAEWIRKNGVKKMPVAAVEATTATIPMKDRAAIIEHNARIIAEWNARFSEGNRGGARKKQA